MTRDRWSCCNRIVFLTILFLGNQAHALDWVFATVSVGGASIYRENDSTSEVLGRYPENYKIKVHSEAEKGFYRLHFSPPWKGVSYGWIPVRSLNIGDAGLQSSRSKNLNRKIANAGGPNTKAISIVGNSFFNRPTDIQSYLGDSAYSIPNLGFGLEYQTRLSHLFSISFRGGRYSLNQIVKNLSNPSVSYFANGYTATVHLAYHLTQSEFLPLQLELGGGVSLNTSGSSSTVSQVSTSQVAAYPLMVALGTSIHLFDPLALLFRLGYQRHILSHVPILAVPSGVTPSEVQFDLSSFFLTVGLSLKF